MHGGGEYYPHAGLLAAEQYLWYHLEPHIMVYRRYIGGKGLLQAFFIHLDWKKGNSTPPNVKSILMSILNNIWKKKKGEKKDESLLSF